MSILNTHKPIAVLDAGGRGVNISAFMTHEDAAFFCLRMAIVRSLKPAQRAEDIKINLENFIIGLEREGYFDDQTS